MLSFSYVENLTIFLWCKCFHFELLDVIIFHGVPVIIFEVLGVFILEVLDVIIFSWCTGCNLFIKVSKVSCLGCYHLCYHLMLSFFTVSKFFHFYVIIFPCTYFVLSFMLSFLGCYHLCYHLMLSFFTVSKCYLFYVIIFPCTYLVLSFMLSFDVIIYCYHFPPFFFFLKT